MTQRSLELDQVLHGYHDGHRLLSSSCTVPADAERLMLIMSDMSGSSMTKGFETYLTAYPVVNMKAYAIARTWYAPEMKRPGCVWTHTLLVSNSSIARIRNLWSINELFRRPIDDPEAWIRYKSRIAYRETDEEFGLEPDISPDLIRDMLYALYATPQAQVFLPAKRVTEQVERLCAEIWSQQWTGLRRSFAFCTGSIASRRLDKRAFDLQVVPASASESIKAEFPQAILINEPRRTIALNDPPDWLQLATEDIRDRHDRRLRTFLRVVGIERAGGRAQFCELLETYSVFKTVITGTSPLRALVKEVSKLFPEREEGEGLKRTLFGSFERRNVFGSYSERFDEAEILYELATTIHSQSFDPESLGFRERCLALISQDLDPAFDLALRISALQETTFRRIFLESFFDVLVDERVNKLLDERLRSFLVILEAAPSSAQAGWIQGLDTDVLARFVNRILQEGSLSDASLANIILGLLKSTHRHLAYRFSSEYRRVFVEAVLLWSQTTSMIDIVDEREDLRQNLTQSEWIIGDWLSSAESPSLPTLFLATLVLDPYYYSYREANYKHWKRFAIQSKKYLSDGPLIESMVFILSLGFYGKHDDCEELVIRSFETVYRAAESNDLGPWTWEKIAPFAPSASWGGEWNRCERLRIATVEQFIGRGWSEQGFLRTFKSLPDAFGSTVEKVVSDWGWNYKRYRFVKRLASMVSTGAIKATQAQENCLRTV